MIVESCRLTF